MSPGPVIGVDAGGTKLLAGVVHADLAVGHRVRRLWSGGDRAEVLETMVEAVSEARAAAPDVTAVGFGIPALLDFEAGGGGIGGQFPPRGLCLPGGHAGGHRAPRPLRQRPDPRRAPPAP